MSAPGYRTMGESSVIAVQWHNIWADDTARSFVRQANGGDETVMRLGRYGLGARFYDVVSAERAVYRAGRERGIAALNLQRGFRVLDMGCGTGLNLAPLLVRVGASGAVLGIDRSVTMLGRARGKVARHGWRNVELRCGDAARIAELAGAAASFDAVVFTYSLSIIEGWEEAFDQALGLLRPGGRIAVVDMSMPAGRWRVLWPLARLACFTGGADPYRAPWNRLLASTEEPMHEIVKGGHIHVAAGTRPARTVGG